MLHHVATPNCLINQSKGKDTIEDKHFFHAYVLISGLIGSKDLATDSAGALTN